MKSTLLKKRLQIIAASVFVLIIFTGKTIAHCDTMDGPVVKAAQKALETGNINYALIWVQKKDEDEIRKIFEKTMSVRKLNLEAKEMADMYFFETVVRVHRMGEGAPYTGIKPAGSDLGPVIPQADTALETGNTNKLLQIIINAINQSIAMYFQEAIEKKNYDVNNLEAGRNYIKAYVEFVHFVERLYEAAVKPPEHE